MAAACASRDSKSSSETRRWIQAPLHSGASNKKVVPQSAPLCLLFSEADVAELASGKPARPRTRERDTERSAPLLN